jgi:hypothetical protein
MGCVNCASQYKFWGPHLGVLYGRYDLLDRLRAYKVRPAPDDPPGKYETGTQNHSDAVRPRGLRGRWRRWTIWPGLGSNMVRNTGTDFLAFLAGGWTSRLV